MSFCCVFMPCRSAFLPFCPQPYHLLRSRAHGGALRSSVLDRALGGASRLPLLPILSSEPVACPATQSVALPPGVDSRPGTGTLDKGHRNRAETVPSSSWARTEKESNKNSIIVVLLLFVFAAASWECVLITGLSSIGVFVGSTLDLGTAGRLVSAYLPPVKSLD